MSEVGPRRSDRARQNQTMFDRITPRYDLMNTLMTLGLDRRWRRIAVAMLEPRGARALDVGTGTGELALELYKQGASEVIGVDVSSEMVGAAKGKFESLVAKPRISLAIADAFELPFARGSFDCLISGFILRNVSGLPKALAEMARVLRPSGRLVCLELTQPRRDAFAPLYHLYFHNLVPLLGQLVGGNREAYRYLPRSLRGFPDAPRLAQMLTAAGLTGVEYRLMGRGAVTIHVGRRPMAKSSA